MGCAGSWACSRAAASCRSCQRAIPTADEPPPRVRIDQLSLSGGALLVRDGSAQPVATLRLTDLGVAMAKFDSTATAPVPVKLTGRLGAGALRLTGDFAAAPLSFDGNFSLQGLDAEPLLAYLHRALPVQARGGQVDARGAVSLAADGTARLRDGHVDLRQMAIADSAGLPVARVSAVAVDDVALELAARRLSVGRISGQDNWLALTRAADGRLNLDHLRPAPANNDRGRRARN